MPRPTLFKISVAIAAAAVGAILAISTVFAHSTPATHRSLVTSIVSAAHTASFPVIANEPVPNAVIDKQIAHALTAEELAAKIAAEQAELAAKLAALKAAAAAAADPCVAADAGEDATEKANEKIEDAAEKADPGKETSEEDATEKANETIEDAAEKANCPGLGATKVKTFATFASGTHHFEGRHHH